MPRSRTRLYDATPEQLRARGLDDADASLLFKALGALVDYEGQIKDALQEVDRARKPERIKALLAIAEKQADLARTIGELLIVVDDTLADEAGA